MDSASHVIIHIPKIQERNILAQIVVILLCSKLICSKIDLPMWMVVGAKSNFPRWHCSNYYLYHVCHILMPDYLVPSLYFGVQFKEDTHTNGDKTI